MAIGVIGKKSGMTRVFTEDGASIPVTVIEMLDRILPQEDADISKAAQRYFKKRGMKFFTGAKLDSLDVKKSKAKASWTDKNGNEQEVVASWKK